MPSRKPKPELAIALRHFAWSMTDDPLAYTQEDGRLMDRALRSCDGILDIDRVDTMALCRRAVRLDHSG